MTNVETQNDSTKESLFNDSPRIVKMTLLNLSVYIENDEKHHKEHTKEESRKDTDKM